MNGSSGGVGWLLILYHKFNSIRERERERAESREVLILEAIHEVTRGHLMLFVILLFGPKNIL